MEQVQTDRPAKKTFLKRQWKLFAPLAGVAAVLGGFALLFLGYDVAKGKVSPCDSIFQEASVGMTTKIKFLKAEGELKLGREKVAELSERAQMAALGLKTCCVVLDAGRIDPEQFLSCKSKARAYDSRVEEIVAKVQAVAVGNANAAPELTVDVAKAIKASRELNQIVVKISQEQQVASLQTAAAEKVAVTATESEPNNDAMSANLLSLSKVAKASIAIAGDVDVFTFVTPPQQRDWFRIELKNLSTTLEPNIELLDSSKTSLGVVRNTTSGGDLTYEFVGLPSTTYSFRVSSYSAARTGVYAISAVPRRAYDSLEPNETVLTARPINGGVPVKAGIMDNADVDYFVLQAAGTAERNFKVVIGNNSPDLHPNASVYDGNKSLIKTTNNATAGGDLQFDFKSGAGPVYIRISDHYQSGAGAYTLTVIPQ